MNDVKALTPLVQKRTEGIQTYYFQCLRDGAFLVPESRYTYQAAFATEESLIKQIPMAIDGNQLKFGSDQLLDLPAGIYKLEVWETIDNVIHAIYPSDRKLRFTVKENVLDLPEGTVSSLTLDEFKRRFDDIANHFHTGKGDSSGTITANFKVGKVETAEPDQPATVELVDQSDGITIINYRIPRGRDGRDGKDGKDGKTWEPYIANDGNWHIKQDIDPEIR